MIHLHSFPRALKVPEKYDTFMQSWFAQNGISYTLVYYQSKDRFKYKHIDEKETYESEYMHPETVRSYAKDWDNWDSADLRERLPDNWLDFVSVK